MKPLVFTAAVLGAAVLATPAAAQRADWENDLRILFTHIRRLNSANGFKLEGTPQSGELNNQATQVVEMPFEPGRDYRVTGACAAGCGNLDLRITDADGNEIGADLEDDSVPMVPVRVEHAGTYKVEVRMTACSADPCHFGLAVFRK